MSATNHTTHYNLPVFVETDKPAWLVDFNGAMNAIDAAIYTNAQALAQKENALTFNDGATVDFTREGNTITAELAAGTAGDISRAIKKPVTAPEDNIIFGEDANGDQLNLAVGSGLSVENGVLKAIDLNLSLTGTATVNVPAAITNRGTVIYYALNADKSVGKIYGYTSLSGMTVGQTYTLRITNPSVKATGAAYTIGGAGLGLFGTNNLHHTQAITMDASGNITIEVYAYAATCVIYFLPCLYFFADFGDVDY